MGTIRLSAAQFAAADQGCTAAQAVAAADDVGDYQSGAASPQDYVPQLGAPPTAFDDVGSDATQVPVD